jgi:hypothetical protein
MTELGQALEVLGASVEASGVVLDLFPAGIAHRRVKTLICWERLVPAQLIEDWGVRSLRACARKGRYVSLTIFLLQECLVRSRHLDNCAVCENL